MINAMANTTKPISSNILTKNHTTANKIGRSKHIPSPTSNNPSKKYIILNPSNQYTLNYNSSIKK